MIDIIIPTYKNEAKTIACFTTIAANTTDYRVLWVDNGSGEDSVARAAEAARVLKWHDCAELSANEGFAAAVNYGLRRFLYERLASHVVLLNNDVLVTPHWLERLLEIADAHSSDAIGPISGGSNPQSLTALAGQVGEKIPAFAPNAHRDKIAADLYAALGDIAYTMGNILSFFCVLFPRRTIEQVGLLDDHIFAYGEDNDYIHRMRLLGLRNIHLAGGVYVEHEHNATAALLGADFRAQQMAKADEYLAKKYAYLNERGAHNG